MNGNLKGTVAHQKDEQDIVVEKQREKLDPIRIQAIIGKLTNDLNLLKLFKLI